MMKRTIAQFVLTITLLVFGTDSHAQLFPNGDFELGTGVGCACATNFTCGNDAGRVIDGTHPIFVPGNQGCISSVTNYAPQLGAHGGTGTIYFYAGGDNYDAQAVNFVGGEEVCLSVWYCGPQGAGASGQNTANSHFSFKLNGGQIGPDVQVPVNTGWTEHTFTVIMTPGNHTFGILSGGAAQYSIWTDDFQATLCSAPCDPAWTTTTACSTDPPINLDLLITGDTGGTWSGTGVTGNMFDPSGGTQSITYTAPGGCNLVQSITVTTSAVANWTPPIGLCSNSAPIDLSTTITGTTGGTWSGTGITGNMFDPSVGTQSITYTVGTAPCDDVSIQSITVTTAADAAWTNPGPLCQSNAAINLDVQVTGTAGGTWSGTGVTGNMFDPAGLNGNITVTYSVGTAPCDDLLALDINVITVADASWTLPAGLCTSSAPIDLSAAVTGTAGGTWSGTGITGNIFDPSVGTQSITYTVGVAPCDDVSIQSITVNPTGDATWTNPGPLCESNAAINLDLQVTGTAGGTWSGTGVTGNMFDPVGLNGNITVTYSVGTAPCDDLLALDINVITVADASWTLPTGLCTSSAPIDLSATVTGTAGGTWSGTGITGNMFDPSVGTQSITYTVGVAPCDDVSIQSITVNPTGDATWTNPGTLCQADAAINLDLLVTGTAGGTWSGTGVTGNSFDPAGLSGNITVTYNVGTAPCDDVLALDINVITVANASWTPPANLCSTSPPFDLTTVITGTAGGTWSGTGVTGNMFDPSVGTQTITYTVGTGTCQQVSAQQITIGIAGNPSWTTLTICAGDAPVNLDGQITGDTGGAWSGTGMSGSVFDPFFGTQSITYTVGSAGCLQTSTQSITVIDPQLTMLATHVSCAGLTDGTATVNVTGSSGSQTYLWNPSGQTTQSASNLGAGTYQVTVTDGACTAIDTITLLEPSAITIALTGTNGCSPDLGAALVIAQGGVGGFTYAWTPSGQISDLAVGLDSAMQTVVVTDANGCYETDSVFVQILPPPTVNTINDTTIIYPNCISLPTTGGVTYSWMASEDLDCDDCSTPTVCPMYATEYCVTGTDINGCTNSDCVMINVDIICGEVFVPSAFSPNNDGENDLECVYSDCIESMTFTVYNRWGEQIFETNSMSICWDGTWKGKELNSAVFVYVLDGYLINGEHVNQKGNISLIR